MTNKLLTKALSITASAVLSLTSLSGTVGAFAAEPENAAGDALLSVIVTVTGDAVLTGTEDISYLETDAAEAETAALESTQTRVQRSIRALYPALEIGYSYSTLINGFSCKLPESLLDDVRALPEVKGVSVARQHAVPKMAKAAEAGGLPAYYDGTGCYGDGQVIAVIDSELDTTHPMFAALPEDTACTLTKEKIAEVAAGIGFNVDIDPEQAYLSNKLPYVIDYVDEDPYGSVPNPDDYHGTHVSGIAAGNPYTDSEGNAFSGVAPNAQLVFMAIGIGMGFIDDAAAVAALEDAVKLNANVINMSFGGEGELFGENPIGEAINNAESVGITVCVAAGNSDNGADMYGEVHHASNPDVSTLSCYMNENTKGLAVASADNPSIVHQKTLLLGDQKMVYTGSQDEGSMDVFYLGDALGEGEFPYEYCGIGDMTDYEGKDLTGKIALVDRGELTFEEKAANALEAGAIGMLLVQNSESQLFSFTMPNVLPAGMVSIADGDLLKAAENPVISFSDEVVDITRANLVSDYSSWGASQSLDLRPDIMGIGGLVESAAYGDSTAVEQGTSMATPYLSGCAALLNEYLDETGCTLTGSERARFMRNLMMTAAVPYIENGMYTTPRRQGAGLVSLNNVRSDVVLLTGKEGESKIMLRDKTGSEFSFDITLTNLSGEAVNFTDAQIALTTDDAAFDENEGDYVISGQQPLIAAADLSALTSLEPGESRTETVTVSLDAEQYAALSEIFTNGFFVDGYLLLSGAENCCDISVPMLGFTGDWSQIPIFDFMALTNYGNTAIVPGTRAMQLAEVVQAVLARVPAEELEAEDAYPVGLFYQYATEEELAVMSGADETVYISPNGDGLSDSASAALFAVRNAWYDGVQLYDSEGNLAADGDHFALWKKAPGAVGINDPLETLADGAYTAVVSAHVDYAGAEPQQSTFPVVLDKTAPVLKSSIREENGRTILTLQVTDAALDGLLIIGTGNGGVYGEYDPETAEASGLDAYYAAETAFEVLRSDGAIPAESYNPASLPLFGKLLLGAAGEMDLAECDFSDLIAAEPDASGSYTLEYDITDLSYYNIAVLDRALNMSSLEAVLPAAETLEPGLRLGTYGIYEINEDTIRFASFVDGAVTEMNCTFADGVLTMTGEDELTAEVTQVNSLVLRLSGDVNDTLYPMEGASLDEIEFYPITYFTEQVSAVMDDPSVELVGLDYVLLPNGKANLIVTASMNGNEETLVIPVNLLTGEAEIGGMDMDIDLSDLFGTLDPGIYQAVFCDEDETFSEMRYFVFNEDGVTGKMVMQADGTEIPFTYTIGEDMAYHLDLDGEEAVMVVFAEGDPSGGDAEVDYRVASWNEQSFMLLRLIGGAEDPLAFNTNAELIEMAKDYEEGASGTRPEEIGLTFTPEGEIVLETAEEMSYTVSPLNAQGLDAEGRAVDLHEPPKMPANAIAEERLLEMAKVDYQKKTGVLPANAEARLFADGSVRITLTDGEGNVLDRYTVDAVTGVGSSQNGDEVNLPQTGVTSPANMLTLFGAVMLLAAGAYLTKKSGIFAAAKAK